MANKYPDLTDEQIVSFENTLTAMDRANEDTIEELSNGKGDDDE